MTMVAKQSDLMCEDAMDLIGPLADGELDRSKARVLEVHLSHCASCRNELDAIKRLRVVIRSSVEEGVRLMAAGNLARRIETALDSAHPKRALWLQPDRKSTRLNSSHIQKSRMPSSA